MDADGLIQSRNQSNKIAMDGGGRCMQQRKDVYLPMNASSSISTVQGCMEGDQSQDRYEGSSSEVNIVDGNILERDVNDILQGSAAVRQMVVRSERMSYIKSRSTCETNGVVVIDE